jgi:hypothetical protein
LIEKYRVSDEVQKAKPMLAKQQLSSPETAAPNNDTSPTPMAAPGLQASKR